MKKFSALLLLVVISFSPLFAQARQKTKVYVSTITGNGGGPNDAAYFSRVFTGEIAAYGYTIVGTRSSADFTVSGTIYPSLSPGEGRLWYTLHMKLINNRTGLTVVEQEMYYETAENSGESLLILVFHMFANIYTVEGTVNQDWREQWFFLGAWTFWSPRIYRSPDVFLHPANIGAGLSWELNFAPCVSFESGLDCSLDILPEDGGDSRSVMLAVPLLLKLVMKPGKYPLIEPYGGVQYNMSPSGPINPPMISWAAGLQVGAQAGAGAAFFDCRVLGDVGDIERSPGTPGGRAERIVVEVGLGYKFGAGKKQ